MNELQLYFGHDYVINDYIKIKHPRIKDIVRMGEDEYFGMINLFTSTSYDLKVFLYDNFKIIWEDVSDWDCFVELLFPQVTPEISSLLFSGLDITKFQCRYNPNIEENVLVQEKDGHSIVLDSLLFRKISDAIRLMHGMQRNYKRGSNKTTQLLMIDLDRQDQAIEKRKREKEGAKSFLLPMVSSLVNCSDFKYGVNEIEEMPIYAFMDSVARVQIVRNTTALLQGSYSGMIDVKKINKEEFNFMREIKKS